MVKQNLTETGPTVWSQFIFLDQKTGDVTVKHNNNPDVANNTVFETYFVARTFGDRIGMKKVTFTVVYPSLNEAPKFI